MLSKLRDVAIATCVAVAFGLGALYVTRPSPPQQTAGRDYPGMRSPEPLSADEIGYQVAPDRIRSIDAPNFIAAGAASFVPDRMPVIGVAYKGRARAYPVPVLSRVEIVNDELAGRAIAVTW